MNYNNKAATSRVILARGELSGPNTLSILIFFLLNSILTYYAKRLKITFFTLNVSGSGNLIKLLGAYLGAKLN